MIEQTISKRQCRIHIKRAGGKQASNLRGSEDSVPVTAWIHHVFTPTVNELKYVTAAFYYPERWLYESRVKPPRSVSTKTIKEYLECRKDKIWI